MDQASSSGGAGGGAGQPSTELARLQKRYELAIGRSGLGVWDHDYENNQHYWSAEFRRLIGVGPDVTPDSALLLTRVHPEDKDRAMAAMRDQTAQFDLEHRIVMQDGAVRWIRARGQSIRGADGAMLRTAGVVSDITQEVEAKEFRREIWAVLADVNRTMPEKVQGVLELACRRLNMQHGGIVHVEGDVCEFLYQVHPDGVDAIPHKVDARQTIAGRIYEANDLVAIPDLDASAYSDLPARRASKMRAFIGAPLIVLGRKYGAIWLASSQPRDPFGAPEEAMVLLLAQAVGRELGRAHHMQQLKDSEQRFLLAAKAARVGISEWQVGNWEEQYWSDNFYRMLGYEPGEIPSRMSVFASLIHPEDGREGKTALDSHAQDGAPVEIDFRLKHKTKGYRWFHATAAAGEDHEGRTRIVGSIMDVHDLKMAQERAEAANVAKTQFLATMSHEIRTPLNGVLGMAAALGRSGLDENQRGMLTVINESGGALLQVINQILDLSKIEANKFQLETAPFPLQDLVLSLGAMHDLKAREKGLRFAVAVAPEARGAYTGDSGRIRQILNNLVSNAVKFTEKGEVTLEVTLEGEGHGRAALRFDVRDTGPGMTEEERGRLFTPFTQLDSTDARKHEGTGLGLAISRRLAQMMEGAIEVQSVHGQGSMFSFRLVLPRAQIQSQAEPAENVTPLFGKVRVLSVDDHPTNRMVLEALLKPTGASVVSAESGPQALDLLQAGAFDVVLLDIQMPVMDGMEVLKEIRARENAAGRAPMPVIAVTANALKHQIDEYLAAGFNGHIGKPIAVDALTRVIAGVAHAKGADAAPGQRAAV